MIKVNHLSRAFGDVQAVSDVSFTVGEGEIVGLLGPNGAGKTTTLRMLATLLQPDAGDIMVAGANTATNPTAVRAAIGYHTGDTGLYRRLTPREFLTYFGTLQGMSSEQITERVESLVSDLSMGDYANRLCGKLSTGQAQRVSVARTMLHDPPVLILDEPTSGLDIVSSQFILTTLKEAAQSGRAVLFSTHILSEIELICDRIIVMDAGKIVGTGTEAELLERTGTPNLTRAFLSMIDAQETP